MKLEEVKELVGRHEDERYFVYEDISCPLAVEDFVEWLYKEGFEIVKMEKENEI